VRQIVDEMDLEALTDLLSLLVGELCWSARLGYGDELQLDCGELVPFVHPRLRGEAHGSWMLLMRATPWKLWRDRDLVADSSEKSEVLRERIRTLEGRKIEACRTRLPDLQLTLSFSDRLSLVVGTDSPAGRVPSSADVLAYWQALTPDRMLVSAGPGLVWSYRSADAPV
jgi:hypothetical protein